MTDRAGRWVTEQVGRHGRTVNEVALELDCDWHTVNDTVIAYGSALADDPDRIGAPTALGLDETLFVRVGPRHRQVWSTSIVDVRAGRLLDVVLVAAVSSRADGSPSAVTSGVSGSPGRRWICRVRIGRCSTRCCPTPFRSRIRFMS
jgi:hypothetical protein